LMGYILDPPALVMPYMQEGSLHGLIQNDRGQISLQTKLKYLRDAARGVAYIHQSNVIHGDLKPQNILIDENNGAIVADFGISKLLGRSSSKKGTATDAFTTAYAAPEVLRDRIVRPESDSWSWGILMWSVATELHPFSDEQATRTQDREWSHYSSVVERGVRPPLELLPREAPPEYGQLITECLNENPELRPSFTQIVERLNDVVVPNLM